MKAAIVAVVVLLVLVRLSLGEDADTNEFAELMGQAQSATDRDSKVECLRRALLARPGNVDNIAVEFEIASLLHTTTSPNQPTRPLVALDYYDRILTTYKYEDYYASRYGEGGDWMKLRQSLFVQSAIQAGCIHNYVLKEPEKGREYLYKAMEMLNSTFERRKADWAREPRPEASPPELADAGRWKTGGDGGAYEYQVQQWMQRQKRAQEGDVFERTELLNAEIAVKHYGLTYGPQPPELVPVPMRDIIAAFPGTPMAAIAQKHIDRALKMATEKISKESDNAVMSVGEYQEPMPMGRSVIPVSPPATPARKVQANGEVMKENASQDDRPIAWAVMACVAVIFVCGIGCALYFMKKRRQ